MILPVLIMNINSKEFVKRLLPSKCTRYFGCFRWHLFQYRDATGSAVFVDLVLSVCKLMTRVVLGELYSKNF